MNAVSRNIVKSEKIAFVKKLGIIYGAVYFLYTMQCRAKE